jgi:hypothetical protein
MLLPDSLRTNPYRILRLSSKATISEIHKAAASIRREARLGRREATTADLPFLGQVSRTERDILAATGRLQNPEQRITDRLFWFHAVSPDGPTEVAEFIEANGAGIRHDKALRALFDAIHADLDDAGVQFWVGVLRAWHRLISHDEYWSLSLDIEERGAFEPAALPSELQALRDNGVSLAAEPLLSAARDAILRDERIIVRQVFTVLETLADTGRWAAEAQWEIISPVLERFQELCNGVRQECGSKVIRDQNGDESCWVDGPGADGLQNVQLSRSERNKSLCQGAVKRFRNEIEPALNRILELVPPDHAAARQSREQAALCLSGIATDYTWADDFITSEKLRNEALALAADTVGAIRIEEGLDEIRKSARKQRIFGALEPISSAPMLGTINGFGCTIYGNSNHDPESGSYEVTHYFVALFVPILPIARYRVIWAGGNKYQFLGKLPLRKVDRWHLGIVAAAMIVMLISFAISSKQGASSAYAHSADSSYGSTDNTATSASSQASDLKVGDPGQFSATPATSGSSELSDLKARIESGRSQMEALKAQLQPVIDELNDLDTQMEPLSAELKKLKEQHDAGIEIDIDGYNGTVRAYNTLLRKRRALFAANKHDLQAYDDLTKQDSLLVDKYNSLLK